MDLRDALIQGFGDEPPHLPVSERLEAGHRAVRRRRTTGAVLAVVLAAPLAIGVPGLVAGERGSGAVDQPSLVEPDPSVLKPLAGRREKPGLEGLDRAHLESPTYEEGSPLVQALQQLPTMQRKVVVLRHMLDLSVAQTADELGIAEGTVKSHSSRGLTALAKALEAAGSN